MRDLADLMEIIALEVAKDGGTARLGKVDYREGVVEENADATGTGGWTPHRNSLP